ncbi:hypothetical protein DPMN_010272 [Dreissena polymorpha]|uniref:Uncharacterized protein n=1 Tax=Dreissena polymorpha TaxID=45954 RepID=A0A9D4N1W9_DREPO|nr:hypothetical protein DPMN_010272 [Dreissena polymorpha]
MQIGCDSCKRPDDTDLAQQLAERIATDNYWPMYALHPGIRVPGEYKDWNENVTLIGGTRKCRATNIDIENKTDVMDLSTCPWYLVMTYDKDRFPAIMITTRCRCPNCFTQTGNQSKEKTTCKPITIPQPVLRKSLGAMDLNSSLCKYDLSYQIIGVGCTCTLQRSDLKSDSGGQPKPSER